MASTIELQRTINRTSQFLRLQPLLFQKNTANDPAFSNADWVKQLILSPPFAWRWNRTAATFTDPTFVTIIGQTDYVVNLPTFGWIEKAVAYEPVNGYLTHELQVGLIFGADAQTNQPARISAQFDDTTLEGHSFSDIASSIGSNENTIGVNVDASAAYLTKAICSMTGQKPAATCAAVAALKFGSNSSSGTSSPAT